VYRRWLRLKTELINQITFARCLVKGELSNLTTEKQDLSSSNSDNVNKCSNMYKPNRGVFVEDTGLHIACSALTLLVRRQEEHPTCKN